MYFLSPVVPLVAIFNALRALRQVQTGKLTWAGPRVLSFFVASERKNEDGSSRFMGGNFGVACEGGSGAWVMAVTK